MPEEGDNRDSFHRLLKERSADAWSRLLEQNGRLVYGYLEHRLGRRDRAAIDELYTDVWSHAVQSIHGYAGTGAIEAWLLGIAGHLSASHLRSRSRARAMEDIADVGEIVDPAVVPPGEQHGDGDEFVPILLAVVNENVEHSTLFRLRYLEGKSNAEIAAGMGTTEKAIEGRLRRAREDAFRRARKLYPDVVRGFREGIGASPRSVRSGEREQD